MAAGHPVIEVDGLTIPTDSMRILFGDEKWLRVNHCNRQYHCRVGEGYQKFYRWGGKSFPNLKEVWEKACTSLGVAAYSSDTKARVEQARALKRQPPAVVAASSSADISIVPVDAVTNPKDDDSVCYGPLLDMEGVIVPTTYKKIRDRLKLLYLVLGFAGPAPFD